MSDPLVSREDRDGVAVLTMQHGKANAFDVELVRALRGAIEDASSASAIVLTGRGSIFSAGVDLNRLLDGGATYTREFLGELSPLFRELFTFPRPVVAAVNGHAIAGGCVLALCCDLRLGALGEWRMGAPELLVGVPFPTAALEIVRFQTPPGRLGDVLYCGSTQLPEDSRSLGWLDAIVPAGSLLETAERHARQMGALPQVSFALTKRMHRFPALARMDELSGAHEADIEAAWTSEDVRGAVAAYVERVLKRS